jgi:hypothetical protein
LLVAATGRVIEQEESIAIRPAAAQRIRTFMMRG